MPMKKWMAYSFATLAAAVIVHLLLALFFPSLVLRVAYRKIAARAGGVNIVVHNPPTTAANNPIVNSSPDLLYSACAFDLSAGPVRVRARVPATYWSVSGYDGETNNFFSVNSIEERSGSLDLVLVGPGGTAPGAAHVVRSPSRRGVLLFRTLVPTADKMEEMIRVQKQAVCVPL
jgi:uncharacterized membrane protein